MVAKAARLGGAHHGVWCTFDIADAFSTISIDDRSREALGAVHWPGVGHLMYEKAPFGLASSSALLAITLSFSVELALDAIQERFKGAVACDVYCDDGSLFVPDPLFKAHGQAVWELFSYTMQELGWRFSEAKTSGKPSRVFEQRGLAFNFSSSPGFISLKVDKRREYGGEFLGLAKRGRDGGHVSYRELRRLLGKAAWAGQVCRAVRLRVATLWSAFRRARRNFKGGVMTQLRPHEIKDASWIGNTLLSPDMPQTRACADWSARVVAYVDSSGELRNGVGAVVIWPCGRCQLFRWRWNTRLRCMLRRFGYRKSSGGFEMCGAAMLFRTLAPQLAERRLPLVFAMDAQVATVAINKGTARSDWMRRSLRAIAHNVRTYNIPVCAAWWPREGAGSACLPLADALGRFTWA